MKKYLYTILAYIDVIDSSPIPTVESTVVKDHDENTTFQQAEILHPDAGNLKRGAGAGSNSSGFHGEATSSLSCSGMRVC